MKLMEKNKTVITENADQTCKLAEEFAKKCPKLSLGQGQCATVIGLTGDLGSGKTTFTQAFAKALGVKSKITSPTFVIEKIYKLKTCLPDRQAANLIHIDAYRIQNPKELIDLGWKKIIGDPKNIILVEWAEKIKKNLPKKRVQINFKHLGKDKRAIDIRFIK